MCVSCAQNRHRDLSVILLQIRYPFESELIKIHGFPEMDLQYLPHLVPKRRDVFDNDQLTLLDDCHPVADLLDLRKDM